MRRPRVLAPFRHKGFSLLAVSQTVSQFGDKLDYIALLAVVGLQPARHVPLLLSQLALVIALPGIALGPAAGVLADRRDKKRLMVACDAGRAVCAASIPAVYAATGSIRAVFPVVFVMFVLGLIFNAAKGAIIPGLVPADRVLAANASLAFFSRGATFLGMLLGGLIVGAGVWNAVPGLQGWEAAFYLDAASFVASALLLALLPRMPASPRGDAGPPSGAFIVGAGRDLGVAFRALRASRPLAFAFAMTPVLTLAGAAVYALMIPRIQNELGWGTKGVGLLAAGGAVGLLLGALAIGGRRPRGGLGTTALALLAVVGGLLAAFPFIDRFWLMSLAALAGGAALSPLFIIQDTLIQNQAPEGVRGRLFALREWGQSLSFVAFAFLAGAAALAVERRLLLGAIGAAIALVAAGGLASPLRDAGRPRPAAAGEEGDSL